MSELEYATGVVHLDEIAAGGSVRHHRQRFDRGRLVDTELDVEPGPWALCRPGAPDTAPRHDAVATLADLEAVRVRVGEETAPLPPLDDLASPAFATLPEVPHATMRVRLTLTATPAGRLLLDVGYRDARREPIAIVAEFGEDPEPGRPAIDVTLTWRNYLRMRAGEINSLEAVEEGGTVDGRWTVLMLLHGLVQSPPTAEAYASLPAMPEALTWWAEALAGSA